MANPSRASCHVVSPITDDDDAAADVDDSATLRHDHQQPEDENYNAAMDQDMPPVNEVLSDAITIAPEPVTKLAAVPQVKT